MNDILVMDKARTDIEAKEVTGLLSVLQKEKLSEISGILDSIHEVSIDDELDALKVALEEIRDR